MSQNNWFFVVAFTVVGVTLGLLYGWVISPVQYIDTTPSSLRADYRTDYTLMVAETFQHDHNLDNAVRHLAILGSQPPAQLTLEALNFALLNHYAWEDITLLQNFQVALQAGQSEKLVPFIPTGEGQP
jgi:hypothetical protein